MRDDLLRIVMISHDYNIRWKSACC